MHHPTAGCPAREGTVELTATRGFGRGSLHPCGSEGREHGMKELVTAHPKDLPLVTDVFQQGLTPRGSKASQNSLQLETKFSNI